MEKNVRNVNKGKHHKKKHYFKINDPVVFKWWGDRDYGYVSELTFDKEGIAQYTVRATGLMGCVYKTLELDDPEDPYCYISSVLTNSISEKELKKVDEHKNGKPSVPAVPTQKLSPTVTKKRGRPKKSDAIDKTELKKAIKKQEDFINGNVNKLFW